MQALRFKKESSLLKRLFNQKISPSINVNKSKKLELSNEMGEINNSFISLILKGGFCLS